MRALGLLTLTLLSLACDDAPPPLPASGALHYDIHIDGDGYHPDRVRARAGEPVTLVFHRADERNCGGEVVFASENIRRSVPVGDAVEVTFTPASTGELTFTCGMEMYRGTVEVR